MWQSLVFAALIGLAIVVPCRLLRVLSTSGALTAWAFGTSVVFWGGTVWVVPLLTAFTTASLWSKVLPGRDARARRESCRDMVQVLANGSCAWACLGWWAVSADPLAYAGFVAAFAVLAADTWATEWGRLSTQPPRHVLTGRPLARGESGGVSLIGTVASAAGAATVAASAGIVLALQGQAASWGWLLGIGLTGLAGSLLDSVLGATLQARFTCPACGAVTEDARHCGVGATPLRGWRWLGNDLVNLTSIALATAGWVLLLACCR